MNAVAKPFSALGPATRAWAKVSFVVIGRGETYQRSTGLHVGFLHSDPECHYLRKRTGDGNDSKIVEITGELLGVIEWCSKCNPRRGSGASVHVDHNREFPVVNTPRVFALPATTKLLGSGK